MLFRILRDRGYFGIVKVFWELYDNSTGQLVVEGEDFAKMSGAVSFDDLQQTAALTLTPLADGIPEYDEHFDIHLYNITGK